MDKVRSFETVRERVGAFARSHNGRIQVLGEVDGYPIVHLTFGFGRPVIIGAGIHGEEPGSVEGLLLFLETEASKWMDRFHFDVFPCLSPYGYERHHRLTMDGKDPNRQFNDPDGPLTRLVTKVLEGKSYEITLDLHEDSDFDGFYMYERCDGLPKWAPFVRDAMAIEGPFAVEASEPPVQNGIVVWPDTDDEEEDEEDDDNGLSGDPIAFRYMEHSPRHFTLETPGHQPLEMRARMHRAGVIQALTLLG